MTTVKNDVPLADIRKAAGKMAPAARRKAFEAGTTIAYSRNGQIVRESADGQTSVVGPSKAMDVIIRKRIWKLK